MLPAVRPTIHPTDCWLVATCTNCNDSGSKGAGSEIALQADAGSNDSVLAASLTPEEAATLVAAIGILLGWMIARLLRKRDHATFVLARAPRLPIRALATHDDAWLTGKVRSRDPLLCPWFDISCVAYTYLIEKEVTTTRTVTDKDGKTRTETSTHWETVHSEGATQNFDLDDGEQVRVLLREADNEAMEDSGYSYQTMTRRHCATYLPIDADVSVLGVKLDDGTFGSLREVPLLVTRLSPKDRVKSSHSAEAWLFFFALLFPFAGVAVAAGIARRAETGEAWAIAASFGLIVWLPQWWLLTYNRLVRLRHQVTTAKKQISVELAMRHDLVPNLVEVVRAFTAHESSLLQSLAAIRSGEDVDAAVRDEPGALVAVRSVLLLHERHPSLLASELYRDLHERLWAIEEKIAHARSFYDDVVTEWNDRIEKFPSSTVASLAGCKEAPLFAAECDETLPPRLT